MLVEPQKQVMLETATLQLLAKVVDLQYGNGALPSNSFFERLTLELAIWQKGLNPLKKKKVRHPNDGFLFRGYSIFKILSLIFPAGVSASTTSPTL